MGSLVVSRRPGEAVIIRDADGKPFGAIAVSSVRGNRVRIAFDVRRGCEIVRAEKAPVWMWIRMGGIRANETTIRNRAGSAPQRVWYLAG